MNEKDKNLLALVLGASIVLAFLAYIMYPPASGVVNTDYRPSVEEQIPGGALLIVEYSDFKCPYCVRASVTVEQLREIYGDKIYVDFRQFPLTFHKGADLAAEASECAKDQGKFWEYHNLLFGLTEKGLDVGNTGILKDAAAKAGLDTGSFNQCLDSRAKKQAVNADIAEATKLGVTGTPTFFINGEKIVGAQPLEVFQNKIDSKVK